MRLKKYIKEETEQVAQWNDYIHRRPMLASAIKILEKITKKGYEAYLVGGCVRDIILGIEPHDIDITTNCPINELEKIYKISDIGKSKDFGIVVVQEGGYSFELAQYRFDGKGDGRKPETVSFDVTLETDMERRDFKINAMAIDKEGNIIDYFDGKSDIKNKILRTVGDPEKRFSEDYLRIMRLARFSSKLGFEIEPNTKKAASKLAFNITKLSPERIRDEILKSAEQSGDKFADYIIQLDELGILKLILPEIVRQKEFLHHHEHHPESPTVWGHTIAALRVNKIIDPLINICILLHDIGKPDTATLRDHGGTAYFGHAEKGIELVNNIADRLKFSNKEREKLLFAVGNHMKFHLLLDMKPSKVFKLVNDDNWDVLTAVAMADNYSRGVGFKYNLDYNKIIDRAIEIKEKWGKKSITPITKLVDGNNVMKLTGLKPGKRVGEIIKQTTDWILDQNINPSDTKTINDYIMELK